MLLIILLTISAVSCLPVRESLCPETEFACQKGVCISAEWICDNVPDCLNGEDETDCHYLHDCPKNSFMCRTGECLPKEVKCDGHNNCTDGSDEQGCKKSNAIILTSPTKLLLSSSPPSLCHPHDEFSCQNGSCISAEWICDNVPDCLNGEDESDCHYLHYCPKDSFMCRTGECMSKEVKCDGRLSCPDGSDEYGCMMNASVFTSSTSPPPPPTKPLLSPPPLSLCHPDDEFSCKNGACISAEWMCDNVPDCLNGEDENDCHYLHDCPKDSFMCRTGECMPKEVKCDGRLSCPDGSDEYGCMSSDASILNSPTKPLLSSSLSLCHPDDEFSCQNGACISAEWLCDNVPDCLNGEDETDCHYLYDCPEDTFMCRTGECMPKEVKCDGHLSCPDGSDEYGCMKNSSTPVSNIKSAMDNENGAFWIYMILMVLAIIFITLIGLGFWWFKSHRPAADETKVQFLVVEDDGRCTAY